MSGPMEGPAMHAPASHVLRSWRSRAIIDGIAEVKE